MTVGFLWAVIVVLGLPFVVLLRQLVPGRCLPWARSQHRR